MDLVIRPLTPDLWPDFEDLFDTEGAVGRCWCMYWRIGAEYRKRPSVANRDDFHAIVDQGPPPGLLAFDGDTAVGWCQLTPRGALSRLERSKTLRTVDETPVWAISCFYIRKGYRRQGVATALIEANPDRMLWATDWPHPNKFVEQPNDADLLEQLGLWAPDEEIRRRILVDNPTKLYGF